MMPSGDWFAVMKLQRVAGQRPREGTKSCRMGRNSVRPSVHPSVCPYIVPSMGLPKGSEAAGQPEGSEGQPERSEGQQSLSATFGGIGGSTYRNLQFRRCAAKKCDQGCR